MKSQNVVAVLDTNILISAWISPKGIPATIFKRFRNGDFELVLSNEQLEELSLVASRPSIRKYIKADEVKADLNFLKSGKSAKIIKPKVHEWDFPDEKDHFLLDLIISDRIDFLVTGDKLLLSLVQVRDTAIVTPTDFIQII